MDCIALTVYLVKFKNVTQIIQGYTYQNVTTYLYPRRQCRLWTWMYDKMLDF